jgi:tRNA U34 5-methylaminomethyl-2-thiouridine-forming methyltransferase MnmC
LKDKYHHIPTHDGTKTAYSDEFQEAMHSISGAYQEAQMKHVYPSALLEGDFQEINILDVGFGLGYNILALIAEVEKRKKGLKVNVTSLENSESLDEFIKEIRFGNILDDYYSEIRKAYRTGNREFNNYHIRVVKGDARETIRNIKKTGFHGVFHDPFSPSKNPELWTVEFFKEVYRTMYLKGILTTYSSALHIRGALLEAGFSIGRGPSVGGKKEGTLASKSRAIALFSDDDLRKLKENIKSTPYRDITGESSREEILKRRLDEMAEKRSKEYRQAHPE